LNVAPDFRVLAFTAATSLLTGIFFGLWPALQSTRIDLTPTLKESPGELLPWSARRGWRLDRVLLITQVSLSLVLLIGAIQFVRTLTNLENVNLGFNQHHLLLFGIDPTQDGYMGQRVTDFYQELARRIEALPGVRSVGLSENTLIGGGASFLGTKIEGYTSTSAERNGGVGAFYNWVGPTFFETMEIPLILGRTLQRSDSQAGPKVAVVNEEFVRELLGGSNPIGQRFSVGSRTNIEIVGVIGNAQLTNISAETPPTVYLPYLQYVGDLNPMHFEVRTAGNPLEIVDAVRRVAQSMDPRLAIYDVRSQTEQIDQTMFQERLFARLTGFFGALATLLACVGIYGVMAFAVTRRTREVGVRMALGASRSEIVGMILRETFVLVGIGGALGIVAALAASRLISTMLYGLKPNDPLTIAASTLLMLAAAAPAGYMPARRAAKMDPMVALRYE
jgi:predicted permease